MDKYKLTKACPALFQTMLFCINRIGQTQCFWNDLDKTT